MLLSYVFSLVANKAYSGKTWVNDKRHTWKQWKYGHSSLAVDGKENTNLPNCAILDNYYVDKPVFMVDLGSKKQVNGVLVLTWQGAGQGEFIICCTKTSNYITFQIRLPHTPIMYTT